MEKKKEVGRGTVDERGVKNIRVLDIMVMEWKNEIGSGSGSERLEGGEERAGAMQALE